MNKNQLKAILKINGFTEHSSDEEITAVLKSARYSESEIKQALYLLREPDVVPAARADGLHTVFYTDTRLKPREISGLLGIDVDLDFHQANLKADSRDGFSSVEISLIALFSSGVAIAGTVLYMFLTKTGPFHSLLALS